MSDGLEIILGIAIGGWLVTIIGWYYTSWVQQKLRIKKWKHEMKVKIYSEFNEGLNKTINYFDIVKTIRSIDFLDEENKIKNSKLVLILGGAAGSPKLLKEIEEEIIKIKTWEENQFDTIETGGEKVEPNIFSINLINLIAKMIGTHCTLELQIENKKMITLRNQIELIELENNRVLLLIDDIFKTLGDESLLITKILMQSTRAKQLKETDPKLFIKQLNIKSKKLKKTMKEDLEQSLLIENPLKRIFFPI